jgi:hypothetical protein
MTETTWSLEARIQKLLEERAAMIDDLAYLNRMCMTLMSLLPETTTPEDVRNAMAKVGGEIREDRTSGTDTDSAG